MVAFVILVVLKMIHIHFTTLPKWWFKKPCKTREKVIKKPFLWCAHGGERV